ncbi:MAG: sugar phosphate isomerase/epimerase family protein [Planctomycetota bacterium]
MYVSVRDDMLPNDLNLSDSLEQLGLSAVELGVSQSVEIELPSPDGPETYCLASPGDRNRLSARLDQDDLRVCAFLMGNDFSSDNVEEEMEALVNTARAAEALDVPVVRVDLLPHTGDMEESDFMDRCEKALCRAVDNTEEVDFGIENHGGTSNRPQFLDDMLERMDTGRVGITLDTGNFYWFGHPLTHVYELMEKYADRVKHTHLKNIAYPAEMREQRRETGYKYGEYVCPISEGDVDHRHVVSILEKAGYDRSLCIEDESLGQVPEPERMSVLREDVEYLKSLLQ